MLTSVLRNAPRISGSRVTSRISKRSMMAIGEQLNRKEKVEEDRYMRAQEEAWKEKLRKLRHEEEVEKVEQLHNEVISPVKADIADMLKESGDKISDEGLEILAKWKLSL
mmetsp:Transcript_132335/g.382573  ORF Transcript_132335/g.382573 Transcript_132335/m.382573 type:complete len:110 (+) Transcript_132335:129-458(+)|eukprot:CAMPEP_0176074592 /NCGR_PEP_ID=MMETSP0120_2-20121206/37277_1 /TAXON_ID=160619 /ORGANISM="Kryptoperidinium foliaceum, Strain CCMP 1326" /LENGTH=109 /DNA_ID=CAMNT_0017408287 /DNA_START=120 /DNA_END=449 /DNA_ORIENTATION=-